MKSKQSGFQIIIGQLILAGSFARRANLGWEGKLSFKSWPPGVLSEKDSFIIKWVV
jgi:hypothetical protein